MDKEKEKILKLHKERNSLVVQSNTLIRNIKAIKEDLTITEQKIVIYMISKVCAEDRYLNTVRIKISDYCELCGIKKSGSTYENIKESIQSLSNKSWWIKDEKREILFRWIDVVELDNNFKNGFIEIRLSQGLTPYLIDINKNFTKYELINVLCLKSKYSVKLYEQFKSYLWLKKWEIELDEFRELLNIKDKYPIYKELKRTIINPALKEINKYTDLNIELEQIKFGNKVQKLIFNIEEKLGYQMTLELLLSQEDRLKIKE